MAKPILDILYSLNYRLSKTPKFLEASRFNSIIRLVIRIITNKIIPIIYSNSRYTYKQESIPVIVSLTSFPARINRVWIIIESMLRQQIAPEKIILWLSKDQFEKGYKDLPEKLISLKGNRFEIRFVDGDIRSHKKYYYAFNEFQDKYILTIDDDLLFPSTFVKDIFECAKRHPNSVIANFGSRYNWIESIGYFVPTNQSIRPEETGLDLFFGSGGGTLFQPKKLLPFMDNINTIWEYCPTADDIYLNAISRLAGMEITFMDVFPLLSVTNKNDKKLTSYNGNLYDSGSTNAKQLRNLVGYYKKKYGQNPFAI